jgi:hypothetical protein
MANCSQSAARSRIDKPTTSVGRKISHETHGIMESHFRYEKGAVSDAIDDQVQDTGRATAVFEFRT